MSEPGDIFDEAEAEYQASLRPDYPLRKRIALWIRLFPSLHPADIRCAILNWLERP